MRKPFDKDFTITQIFNDYRYRSSYTKFGMLGHNGIDYATPVGTPILAPHSGTIKENAFDASGYGNYVKIENDLEGSVLAHFKELSKLRVGDKVNEGDTVGFSGNTGNSTGPHLHWGYYQIPRNRDNGFLGYIDQEIVFRCKTDIDSDIPSTVEDRFSLKEITYYSKYWTLSDLINDWKAACKDRDSLSALKSSYKELEKRYVKELSEKQEHIESLQKTLSETNLNLATVTENYAKTTLENKNMVLDIEELKRISANDLEEIGQLRTTVEEHENEIERLERELELNLKEIPVRKLIWSILWRLL